MYKIGVVGDKDSIFTFKSIGIDAYPVVNSREARNIVNNLASSNYGLIFKTEQTAKGIEETIERYKKKTCFGYNVDSI